MATADAAALPNAPGDVAPGESNEAIHQKHATSEPTTAKEGQTKGSPRSLLDLGSGGGVAAGAAWALAAVVTAGWPDINEWSYTHLLSIIETIIGFVLVALALAFRPDDPIAIRIRRGSPWALALAAGLTIWEAVTAKLLWLPPPFFAPPQALLEAYLEDWPRLLECALHSSILLGTGYLIGAAVGFSSGLAIGWSKAAAYWGHPVLRLIGPLPPTAWIPIAFFLFPSSWSASVFLIALATAIPVAILTWSGVSSVPASYYDVARTLGAKQGFLVLKVAVPAALPHVFVGLFMGMSASFVVLVVAEMLGVKAGLGWYLQWAQGWAAYANMYAALLVMALLCSGLVTLLFTVRNQVLSWQKGLVRW
ncbi:MAG TPA: ABC transporter permease subunit [Rhodospirillaceae bacterium]|nr:ABC transporter permease subunit [Rhodospirillaceae bacterium]